MAKPKKEKKSKEETTAEKERDRLAKIAKYQPDYIIVENSVEWTKTKVAISNANLLNVLNFYVVHSPCKKSSYSRFDLTGKWDRNPWDSPKFKELLLNSSTLLKNSTYIYEAVQKKFKEKWETTDFEISFSGYIEKEFVLFTYAGENNEFLELLHRIRNSLAHGRFAIKQQGNDQYFVFEDVNETEGLLLVVMRGALKVETLIKWIDIFNCNTTDAISLNNNLKKK